MLASTVANVKKCSY